MRIPRADQTGGTLLVPVVWCLKMRLTRSLPSETRLVPIGLPTCLSPGEIHLGALEMLQAMVRFGFRVPSLRRRIAARTSLKRYVRNSLGLKAPRGWGWITNPRKAAYNRVYNRTTRGCLVVLVFWLALAVAGIAVAAVLME